MTTNRGGEETVPGIRSNMVDRYNCEMIATFESYINACVCM